MAARGQHMKFQIRENQAGLEKCWHMRQSPWGRPWTVASEMGVGWSLEQGERNRGKARTW